MIVPTQNKRLAEEYYKTLPASDINRRYYEEGLQYHKPTTFFGRLMGYFEIPSKIATLKAFYPHHRTVTATDEEYHKFVQSISKINVLVNGNAKLKEI